MEHPTLEETIEFIKVAHKNQVRKSSGKPYWIHPYEVMRKLPMPTESEKHAALLHDVLEDTSYTEYHLYDMGYSPKVIELVKWVTNPNENFSYGEKIKNLVNNAPVGSIKIKWADTTHNVSDIPELEKSNPQRAEKLKNKYKDTLDLLTETLKEKGYDVYNVFNKQ